MGGTGGMRDGLGGSRSTGQSILLLTGSCIYGQHCLNPAAIATSRTPTVLPILVILLFNWQVDQTAGCG